MHISIHTIRKIFTRTTFILILFLLITSYIFITNKVDNLRCPHLEPQQVIAHAGGISFRGELLTNSLEALTFNFEQGHRIFEIDINWTVDDQLVILHDWEDTAERMFGQPKQLTMTEFIEQRSSTPYTLLTLEELLDWLAEHPDATIVTDAKENNLKALTIISKRSHLQPQIIPQIYTVEEYKPVRKLGFCHIIYSSYQQVIEPDDLVEFAKRHQLYGISINTNRAKEQLGIILNQTNTYTYVYTINEMSTFLYYQQLGIDGLFTDQSNPSIFSDISH